MAKHRNPVQETPQEPAQESAPSVAETVAADDAAVERLAAYASENVDFFERAIRSVEAEGHTGKVSISSRMWAYHWGGVQIKVEAMQVLTWEENGKEKTAPALVGKLLIAEDKAREAENASAKVMLGMPYALAALVCDYNKIPYGKEVTPGEALVSAFRGPTPVRLPYSATLRVGCGKDGQPLYDNTKRGRRVLADCKTAIHG